MKWHLLKPSREGLNPAYEKLLPLSTWCVSQPFFVSFDATTQVHTRPATLARFASCLDRLALHKHVLEIRADPAFFLYFSDSDLSLSIL